MKKAFTVCFLSAVDETEDEPIDDPELWYDLSSEDMENVNEAMAKQTCLQCFAHSLKLVVGDGLKETKATASTLAKSIAAHQLNVQGRI